MRTFLLTIVLSLTAALSAQSYAFLTWTVAEGLPTNDVTAIAESDEGLLFVATNGGGLARFDGDEFLPVEDFPGFSVHTITNNGRGELEVTTNKGNFNFPTFDHRLQAIRGENETRRIALDEKDAQLKARLQSLNPSLPPIKAAVKTPEGFLAGTHRGLYLIDERGLVLVHYTAPSNLPGTSVRALLNDRQGRTWIATDGGLARMVPTGIRHLPRGENGPAGRRVSALSPGTDGSLWLGLGREGIQRYDSAGFSRPPIDDPTRGANITSITPTPDGRTYIATNGRGIAVLDDSLRVERLTARSGLPDDRILSVLPADSGRVWAVSYDQGIGLLRFVDSTFNVQSFGADEGVPLTNFTAAAGLPGGKGVLLGSNLGNLYRWQPGTDTEVFGTTNGLPAAPITALALRRETQLWVAVAGRGVFYTDLRMAELRFAPLPSRFGNLPSSINQILAPTAVAEVWLGTDRNLARIFLDANGRPDHHRVYGRAEGFPVAETLAATNDNGQLWFGTTDGLVGLTPDNADGYLAPPPTFFEDINLFYESIDSEDFTVKKGVPEFFADNNHLNFRFLAVDLTYPDRVRYQWRLRPYEREWSPASPEAAVRYAGLAAGRYDFEVRATTDGGKTWGKPAEFAFSIATPFWRQTWIWGLIALAGILVLVGGFYSFYRRIQAGEARKRRQLEAQNQLLTLEQKALQLQMNPHFIFNALNGIRGLVDGQHDTEARAQIGRFAKLMRGILNNSRRETIPLSEEISTLTDYLEMERFCQPFDFTYAITPPVGIDTDEVNMPSMLLQPFLENAVLHGLSSLQDRAGHISVTFLMRGRRMQCKVTDNGIGRAAAARRKADHPTSHKSVALDVTQQRLKAMKGRMDVRDVVVAGGEVEGTEVELFFPVETW